MNALYFIVSGFFFLWIIRNILFWVALWQLKEYRVDRIKIHLTETIQGRSLLLSPISFIKWLAIALYGFVIFNDAYFDLYHFFIIGIFFFEAVILAKEVYYRILKRPVITIKALVISLIIFILIAALYSFPVIDKYTWLLVLDRLVVVLTFVFALIFSIPTEFYRDLQIEKAVKKLNFHKKLRKDKKLLIIGVTGSYGKSSTKDYIAQVLEKNFNVLKTQGTNNTPIGIANTILSGLKKNTEIFVAEMGAYKIGEIAEMCEMVHPTIGVLTAVNYQHVSLFGSIDNTRKAKYELIDSLPKNGLALFNGNNENTAELFAKTQKKKALYKIIKNEKEKDAVSSETIYAAEVVVDKKSVSFQVLLKGRKIHFTSPIVGGHSVENILPAIYVGNYLGMTDVQLKKAISSLTPIQKTMVYYQVNKLHIIDDTFNSNPQAVYAALQYMKIYRKKRILVMQPMIELGKNAAKEHYALAKEIGSVCDHVLLTNTNFYEDIVKGIKDSKKRCTVEYGDSATISAIVNRSAKEGDVIVFEGKESAFVLSRLME